MTKHKEIKVILFDSGDTLVHPIGGKWWPGADFHEILNNHNIRGLSWSRMEGAIEEGIRYLDDHHHLMTVERSATNFERSIESCFNISGCVTPISVCFPRWHTPEWMKLILNSSTIHLPFSRNCTRKDFRSVLYRTLGPPLKENTDYLTCENILRHSSSQPKWDAVSLTGRFSEGRLRKWNCRPKNYCLWMTIPTM